ncbi:MAG: PKD domain-containing protein [Bacteroidota bacterium]
MSKLHAQVDAIFTSDVTAGCSPLTVRFTDLSTGDPDLYLWNFGNGNTSTFDDVIATYTTPGTYTVSLTVIDTALGSTDTETRVAYITVYQDPTAAFTSDTTSGCAPLSVNFQDASSAGTGSIVSWTWDFGDGTVSSLQNPNHIYYSTGRYDITLVVEDTFGCRNSITFNDYVDITEIASVDFTASPTNGCSSPLDVTFTPSISPAGSYTYLWDFGDGSTSISPTPTHTYLADGDYTVSLTVVEAGGCQERIEKSNYVIIANPVADFVALQTTACVGTDINFINQSSGANSFLWSFGDGNTSTQTDPVISYSAPGTYQVSLNAINTAGCNDIETKTAYITIYPTPAPAFVATPSNRGCDSPMFVTFVDNSIGNIVSWQWDFGNGHISTSPSPTTAYLNDGLYSVSLTVTSTDGCQATETIPNYIQLAQPNANFVPSITEGCIPLNVNFTNLSTSLADSIVTYLWDFGDGTSSNQINPSHTYTVAGQYNVTLTVIAQNGCSDTYLYSTIDAGLQPTASFFANPQVVCVNQDVNFTSTSIGPNLGYFWSFGDGGEAFVPNPTHTYQDTGSYGVQLMVENFGCWDTLFIPAYIQVQGAVSDFLPAPIQACNPPTNVFMADASYNAQEWYWDFGDGGIDSVQNPSHVFNSVGTYTITQVALDTVTGCSDQSTFTIDITNPVAGFSAVQTYGCAPMAISFTNSSVNANLYFWDFGDGSLSNDANPTHSYTSPGVYTVQLIASDGVCVDTLIMDSLITIAGPTANFDANDLTGCAPLSTTLNDLSINNPGAPIVSWQWGFSDGGTATGPNPSYTFNTAGDYDVSLIILDADGCIDTLTRNAYIQPTLPVAAFTTTDSTSCPGSLISFINQSSGVGLSYSWDFGDGNSSITPNPFHLYPLNGDYTVSLTATDVNGCTDTEIKSNFVSISKPIASFIADTTSATCPPLTVSFTDQSNALGGTIVSWLWDFGDGSVSTLPNPQKVFSRGGDYTISLIVATTEGCRDTVIMPDFISISGPSGSFTQSPNEGCQPLDVTFSVQSPNPSWIYNWDFGDGTGGGGSSVLHTYFNDTTITPILLVEDSAGCVVPIPSNNPIIIRPEPTVNFVANQTEICLGESITFTNQSIAERPIVTYEWDFGDGNTSSLTNPNHAYTDTGIFVVRLRAYTIDGCTDTSTSPVIIRVTSPPSAIFSPSPNAGCNPSTISFLEASTGDFPLVDWSWNFGDGNGGSGQFVAPHTYTTAGIYNATLTVTDTRGCTGTQSQSVTIFPLPTPDFTAFRYGCAPISVAFTDNSSASSTIVAWEWDFGDGLTSTVQNPTHIYASNGNYTVSLTVTDANGCQFTIMKPDFIKLDHPSAAFTSDAGPSCPPQTVNFSNLSASDTTLSYSWNFGDGSPLNNQENPSHIFYGADTFDVQLIVTDPFGCRDTALLVDHVVNQPPPNSSFTVSDSAACVPENIVFTASSTGNGGATVVSYLWDFGNGTTSSSATTSNLYTAAGTYTVSLTSFDSNGCADTAYKTIIIFDNPVVDFIAGDTVGCAITNIQFTDMTTGTFAPVSWSWDFGDGNTGASQNPVNTYMTDGSYTVTLTATDINGCSGTRTRANYIELDHPTANFTLSSDQSCPDIALTMTDVSTGPFAIINQDWDFGDGSPAGTGSVVTHSYGTPGLYTLTLTITDAIGCMDTFVYPTNVEVFTGPTAAFSFTPTTGCNPLTVNFTNNSVAGSAAIVSTLWDFGDGTTTGTLSPSHTYTSSGVYTVSQILQDANGCLDTLTQQVEVFSIPVVNFVANPTAGCAPQAVRFIDSTQTAYPIVNWYWDFGDGSSSTSNQPTHIYAADGVYSVKLITTDINGCVDSLTKTNYIRMAHPNAAFTANTTTVCPDEPVGVTFTDATVHDTTLVAWSWDFGDGNTATGQVVSHSYAVAGDYTVVLTVTDVLGCSDTDTLTNFITVRNGPQANFSFSDSTNCTPLASLMTDLSTAGDAGIVGWTWDYGNGDGSIQQNPSYTWATAGTYNVTLTVVDANTCYNSITKTATALELPVTNFMTPDTFGCAPLPISFTNLSTTAYPVSLRKWYFGDGDSAINILNPTHTYLNDGNYTVTLITVDANGCSDTLTKTNYIRLSHPVGDFTIDVTEVCPNIPIGVTFTDASIADHILVGWNWNFGDGNTSNVQNPSHSFNTPGNYQVILQVTNVYGCSDIDTFPTSINVLTPPTAAYTVSDTQDCEPFTVTFTDASVNGSGTINSWEWDFIDGGFSLLQNPSYTFNNDGVYPVELKVTDDNGCQDSIALDIEAFALPEPYFVANDSFGCEGQTFAFTDLTSGAQAIVSWLWDFGDGNTSTLRNPSHVYASVGVYDVSLTVTDAEGCVQSFTKANYINLTRPVADFSADQTQVCPGTTISFTDNSTPDHPLTSWLWDFGDGNTSNLQNPTHVYHTAGNYTVTLTIQNSYGCDHTEIKSNYIRVWNPPTTQFTLSDTSGCSPLTVNFTNTSVGNDGAITSILWRFGNGDSAFSNTPSAIYTTAGTYTVILEVNDANGCQTTATEEIEIFDNPAASFFSLNANGCPPLPVAFVNTSTGPAGLTSFEWDFGNGSTSTAPSPSELYTNYGSYDVQLIITDVNGCQDTMLRPNYVNVRNPQADYTVSSTDLCEGELVTFTDATLADTTLVNWTWDFGDGTTGTGQTVQHVYTTSGTYNVQLVVENIQACRDTVIKANVVSVADKPSASFTVSDSISCTPLPFIATNTSVANTWPIVGYEWIYGDGGSSNNLNASHTYTTAGTYELMLVATDQNGCVDTARKTILARELPVAAFLSADTVGCANRTVNFQNPSTGSSPLSSFIWDFGDGNTSTAQFPIHTYTANGAYDVSLIVEDIFGCRDTLEEPNYVRLTLPVADFAISQAQVCPGTLVDFTDASTPDTSLVSWLWDFGDGTTGTGASSSHFYATPGTYTVSLTITNVNGCSDTETKSAVIEVLNGPTSVFIISDTVNCTPLIATFNNASLAGDAAISGYAWDFGNGQVSSNISETIIFSPAGTYNVEFIVTDNNGCRDTSMQQVRAVPLPVADFTASSVVGCDEQITFNDLTSTTNTIVGWEWDFGDGFTSTDQTPTHTYTSTGSYTVSLIVTDNYGCTDTITKPNYINLTRPIAIFAQDRDEVCPDQLIQFFDFSVPDFPLVSRSWDFGDGNTASGQFVNHSYSSPGVYTVTLTIVNSQGCTDSESGTITVFGPPTALISSNLIEGCAPLTVDFEDISTTSGAPVLIRDWNFGNGQTGSNSTETITYTNPGTYTVNLAIIDGNGCSHDTSLTIRVNDLPVADFTADSRVGCAPTTINFRSLATGPAALVAWFWDFGDGNTSAQMDPSHTYSADGVYDVQLIVFDANGCSDTISKSQFIRLSHPQADFNVAVDRSCPAVTATFTDQSIPDTTLVDWAWTFGDGSMSNDQNPVHVYTTPGSFDIRLIVTNVLGCRDTLLLPNAVQVDNGPSASFSPTDTANCTPLSLNFINTSTPGGAPLASYSWDFGNGQTSSLINPSITYGTSGVYTVEMIVTDASGCTDTATHIMTARPLPQVAFGASDSLGCAPQTINFIDQTVSSGGIISWLWNFGDGNTSTAQFPVHTYATDGIYTVSLTVTDAFGCSESLVKPQYIRLSHPQANFDVSTDRNCPSVVATFRDLSVPDTTLTSWNWDFGDGNSSTQQNPVHTYHTAGSFDVRLIVTNVLGCQDTLLIPAAVQIGNGPTASFTPGDVAGCMPLSLNLASTSSGGIAPLISFEWDFGNGQTSTQVNPSITYTNAGVYQVQLMVTNSSGCADTATHTVTVRALPDVEFAVNANVGCAPQAFNFIDQTSSAGGIVSWLWDFGDGNTSTSQFPVHTYLVDGVYDVSLTVTDAFGCAEALTKTQYIRLSHPQANFTVNTDRNCPSVIATFTDLSVPDTTLTAWRWDFGDGNTSSLQNPVHTYQAAGSFDVRLIVTNVLGCEDTLLIPGAVQIGNGPTASFAPGDTADCMPLSLNLASTSMGGIAPLVSFEWDFGNGQTSTQVNPSVSYPNAGVYQVELMVTDSSGCSDTVSHTVTVRALPDVDFVANDTLGCAPRSFTFSDQTVASGAIVSWLWDFGDGNTSTAQFPTHTYTANGNYTVSLIVTDQFGCTSSEIKVDYIKLSPPLVEFTLSPSRLCPGTEVQFTDLSQTISNVVNWDWNFGDGGTSTQANPTHIYHTPGLYDVSLTITDASGCVTTLTKVDTIEVFAPPVATFAPNTLAGCPALDVSFANASTNGSSTSLTWNWDFGNGGTSILTNPSMTYPNPGQYPVQLLVTDGNGCMDTSVINVRVYEPPTVSFTASDSFGCSPTNISFVDQTVPGDGQIFSWSWNFGDGNMGSGQFPTNNYLNDGTYDVGLVVVDQFGCTDSLEKPNYIKLSHPVANFMVASNQECPGTNISFIDQSIPDTTISSWYWDFGDGTSSTAQNPVHFYAVGGNYTISLTVTNIFGCSHTMTRTNYVDILQGPQSIFTPSDLEGCAPFSASFVDNSIGTSSPVVSWAWDFGDGNTSTARNTANTFQNPGVYSVSLTVTDNNGCPGSFSRDITVFERPTANFMSVDTLGCAPTRVDFTDLTTGPQTINTWRWIFGDGGTSAQQFPSNRYNNDGNYDVTLIVTDVEGCRDTLVRPNYIRLTNPIADFTFNQPSGCPGLEVAFTDRSVADTLLTGWYWDFGDGNTSVVQNPTHQYQNPGIYTVSLRVTNAKGCTQTHTIVNAIQVFELPIANYNMTDSIGCIPLNITFRDASTAIGAPINSWSWTGDRGGQSNLQEPVFTFTDAGLHNIKLLVTDANGCQDSITQSIEAVASPIAEFASGDTVGCAPSTSAFQDLSVDSVYAITQWDWTFGDGGISTIQNPQHGYTSDGIYDVSLIAINEVGCQDTVRKPAYIRLSHPVADLVADLPGGCEGISIQFSDMSLADTTIVGWRWDFGDGNGSVQQNPVHTYSQAGTFDVSLVVTNILGCEDSIFIGSMIRIQPGPTADFQVSDSSNCGPFTAAFTNWSTSSAGLDTYQWFVEDTLMGQSLNFSYFFQEEGRSRVKLVVTDNNGCTDTTEQEIFVRTLPDAQFAISDTIGCAPAVIRFTDETSHVLNQWNWDFGDGNTSTEQNPTHTYADDGVYTVSLTVSDAFGCSGSITKVNAIVLDHPETDFIVDYESDCPPVEATFTATSSSQWGIAKWDWEFGDGNTATTLIPEVIHPYGQAGIFDVSLTVTDSVGCTVTLTQEQLIEVYGDIIPPALDIHRVNVLSGDQVEIIFASHGIEEEFQSYTIYREEPGQGFQPIYTTQYINDTTYIDQTANPEESSQCYKVTITNQCGNESLLAGTESHCTVEVEAIVLPSRIFINWNPYAGWDEVSQYEIYRVEDYNESNVSFLGIVPGTVTQYEDEFDDCFNDISYRIRAIGTTPREQSWSDTTMIVGEVTNAASATEVFRATVEDNQYALVEWKAFDLPNAAIIYVEKAENGGTFTNYATLPAGEEKFQDLNTNVQENSYTYRVSAQDSCGNVTSTSNVGTTIHTEARRAGGSVELEWNDYEDWGFGVDRYRIERFNENASRWEVLDFVQGTQTEYVDETGPLEQSSYCYRIYAMEQGGNGMESLSNEVCLDYETSIYAPSAFTPNGDGINDEFKLEGFLVETIDLKIFSRWGLLLFEGQSLDDAWDGTYQNANVAEGTYVFVAKGIGRNGLPYLVRGTVTLLR